MGSCQSTETASGGTTQPPSTRSNTATSNGVERAAPVATGGDNKNAATSASTDPADVSHHSLDESVKSFSSQRSIKSQASASSKKSGKSQASASSKKSGKSQASTSSKSGRQSSGQHGYTSGTSTPDVDYGDASSMGSGEGSFGKRNPKSLGHSSSIIGLDSMIENRREEGNLKTNVVHMEVPFGKPIEEVYDGVHTGPVLGSGISGLVRLVSHKATGVKYAVKCLDLGLVDTEEGLAQLREEIFIMCQLDHPNIVRLEEVYESHTEIYLVQELCLGGELFDRLDEQPDYHYTEGECARLVKQMMCAVRYLHSKGIIHRDLKLENFLFSNTLPDSELKMIDFGLSKHFRYGEVQHEAVGTPYTVAPEVISGSYDERCDIWAIGVIAFLLLSGEPPFGGCGGPEPLMAVRSNILLGIYEFEPADIWDLVSQGARDFIRTLLVVDPKHRPTAREGQKLPWLTYWANRNRTEEDNVLSPNVVKALVNFKEFSDMRKLLCEVLSFTLLPDQIIDLRKEFEKMDTDGSGEISLAALKQVLVTNAVAGSLGALTEEEVEDIFNAMRVKKTETRIHWHEFIAAGLSQCQVDDRNLRLAFDRLDSDHKGYVTLDDIMDLLGNDALHDEEMMREMWGDCMKAVNNCNKARITYDDFLLLMKGQTRETAESEETANATTGSGTNVTATITPAVRNVTLEKHGSAQLITVPEEKLGELDMPEVEKEEGNVTHTIELPSGDRVTIDGKIEPKVLTPVIDSPKTLPLMPLTPIMSGSDEGVSMDLDDTPLSMDDDDDLVTPSLGPILSFTPPATPTRGAEHYISPLISKDSASPNMMMSNPELPSVELPTLAMAKPRPYVRKRSQSMDEKDYAEESGSKEPATPTFFAPDARRAVALPEHNPATMESIIGDGQKSALQVNRQLYRAHRQMRQSVLEASKRFEEQQTRHARDVLIAQQEEEGANKIQAGLVMRRVQDKTVTTEAVKKVLDENRKEQQSLMEVANRRGGRGGRRNRKKTISDIGGMMGSLSQDELHKISIQAAEPSEPSSQLLPTSLEEAAAVPTVIETSMSESIDTDLRGATVPGEFRRVNDPFGTRGKYGRLS